MRRSVQNLFLGPTAGKKDWHAAEGHHADGISGERDRNEFPQTAHFPNVLFVMHSVNDRTRPEKEKRFEKSVRKQMHDSSGNAADTERNHHQPELRNS